MSTPLRDLLTDLLMDPPTRAAFDADPERFLTEHGWQDLDGTDVHAALGALVHELPVDRAARIAPLAAQDTDVDQPGLAGAIAGLEAATAAHDEGPADGLDQGDPATWLDGLDGGPHPDPQDEDPAGGIDAVIAGHTIEDAISAGNGAARRDVDAGDDSEGDDLRFGESTSTSAAEDRDDGGSGAGEAGPGTDGDPFEAVDGPGGEDPAELVGDTSGLQPYDPAEEAVRLDDGDEPDDGFPY